MELKFISALEREPGVIAWLLSESYAALVETEPELWNSERDNWQRSDRSVFENPDTIGACTFLSQCGTNVVGFFCFDPRPQPAYGVIGHNCVLPEFRGQGLGRSQIREILRRFKEMEIGRARVSTNDHPFFIPAQRMYAACGFQEVKRVPWDRDPRQSMIHYEVEVL